MTMMCYEQADLAVTRTYRLSPGVRQDTDPVPPSPASILIVDDDLEVCDGLHKILAHAGYRVQAVAFGAEAIHQVRQEQYEAVLLDMKLPDVDGHSVMRSMMELDPKLPIIVLTGYATVENTVGSLVKGAFAYLTKPYNPDEVMATLKRAVAVKCLAVKAEHVEHALSESEDRFRAVVESAHDAIIIADHRGTILSWNKAAERLFSYTEEEVLGKPLTRIMPARYREAHENGLKRVSAIGHSRVIGKTVELHGLRKDGSEFPLELSLTAWKRQEGTFYSGILRDITERKRAEQRLAAQYAVTRALAESVSLREATPKILQAICESAGWEVGGIWTLDRHAEALRCIDVWSLPGVNVTEFETITRTIQFTRGVGLPGRVWARGEPAWIHDVVTDQNFPRAPIAAKEGLHGAFAFPIMIRRQVVGVIEFFSREIRTPDQDLLNMMADVGIKIGQFVERTESAGRLSRINDCLLSFGKDINENITRLTALCGELMGGAWAIYSHIDGDLLHSIGRWRTPPDFNPVDKLDGHICSDVISNGGDELVVVRNLLETSYAQTDPGVVAYQLQTYIGQAVRCDGSYVGSLCVVYQHDYHPSVSDRRLMGILASAIGVEEGRKKADQALRNAYDETEKILASLPGAMMIADEDQVVVSANALACHYFGEERTTMLGCTLGEILPAEVAGRSRLLLGPKLPAAEVGGLQQEREFEVNKRVYRYRLFPVAFHGSTSRQIGLVIWDITEEKRLQDQLMQAEKLASLGTLVSGMAHEINNPVQAIYGMAELLLEENTSENVKEYARDIYGYSQHIAAVVREFSGYARSASQDQDVEVDFNQRLTDAVKMVRRGPYFRAVEVVTHFGQVPAVLARRSEIDQLFINLISNAAQAMNGKGRLTLTTRLQGQAIAVHISDTGCGIPQALLNRIFDPFFTTKAPGKGTGLGLSIAHKIVTKYGGKITVESEEQKGTTFLIEFPISNGVGERGGAPCLACVPTTQ